MFRSHFHQLLHNASLHPDSNKPTIKGIICSMARTALLKRLDSSPAFGVSFSAPLLTPASAWVVLGGVWGEGLGEMCEKTTVMLERCTVTWLPACRWYNRKGAVSANTNRQKWFKKQFTMALTLICVHALISGCTICHFRNISVPAEAQEWVVNQVINCRVSLADINVN